MPNYVSLTESQRRSIALFVIESQQQAQSQQQGQALPGQGQGQGSQGMQTQTLSADTTSSNAATSTEDESKSNTNANNLIPCKEIVQFCQARFGLTISLSTASRLRSSASKRLATELVNPSAKRNRQVKYPEFEKALVLELKSLEQEQLQIQQEQERINRETNKPVVINPDDIPPVMMLSSEAAITQVAKGIAEKMGVKLGLTSGWYHGFRKRHGIKFKSLKSRSINNLVFASSAAGAGSSSSAPDASSAAEGGDGSDDVDMGPDDEDMEDAQVQIDIIPNVEDDLPSETGKDSSSPLAPDRSQNDQASDASAGLPGTPIIRHSEVHRVTTEAANDALDVISEYLLQNGEVGATKLPLIKELRRFFLSQAEIENRAAAAAVVALTTASGSSSNSNAGGGGGSATNGSSLSKSSPAAPFLDAPIAVSAVPNSNILMAIPTSPSTAAADSGSVSQDTANQLGHLHLSATQGGTDFSEVDPKNNKGSALFGLGFDKPDLP
ncbi:hypothetical protein BG004_001929 [Podila humilis]|nr:hypothetical protein BG004_001929 [Podila humilis]